LTIHTESEKKKGFLDRLPKLGRVSQFMLLIFGFLIIFIPLWLLNQQQPKIQAEAENTLTNLQKILSAEQTPKAKYEAELAQVTAETEPAKAMFPSAKQSPEILDSLRELAELNDIYVTQTKVSTATAAKSTGPVLSIMLGLRGQVSKFENFLLAVDTNLPTSQIKQVTFTVVETEGEYDTATVTIDILCYEGDK
jgi:hypothetical protein